MEENPFGVTTPGDVAVNVNPSAPAPSPFHMGPSSVRRLFLIFWQICAVIKISDLLLLKGLRAETRSTNT